MTDNIRLFALSVMAASYFFLLTNVTNGLLHGGGLMYFHGTFNSYGEGVLEFVVAWLALLPISYLTIDEWKKLRTKREK